MNNKINKAVEALNKGGIIVFPTDTAFGIGCRIDNEDAVERLFNLRRRPKTQATPVLVSSLNMARKYFESVPKEVEIKLIKKFWPGALTIVLPANKKKVPSLVRGGEENVGLRMPNNKTILEIIEKAGVPILGPSANYHKEETPYALDQLNKDLIKQVDFIVEGKVSLKNVSTVVDCSVKPWKIIRQGAVEIPGFEKAILYIDTSDNRKIEIGIEIEGKKYIYTKPLTIKKREAVLSMIEVVLQKHNLEINDLSRIKVNTGPGSFTGLRVGIAVANALGTLLKIPINEKKIGDLENAVYN
jgi:L-threonylcarbamoyladenylate synthase